MLVVGLGNPGPRYQGTRHNVGFLIVDRVFEECGRGCFRQKFQGALAEAEISGRKTLLFKPLGYMNRSGDAVQQVVSFFKLPILQMLVVHDELDLPFCTLRLKCGGGEAGHRGLRSITSRLGSSAYNRLRIGVGRPGADFAGGGADYVLQAFAPAEQALLPALVARATEAVRLVVEQGMSAAMNQVNQRSR